MPDERRFVAFYLPQPIWVSQRVDLEHVDDYEGLASTLEEFVYHRSAHDFEVRACRDGMLLLHVRRLEEIRPADATRFDVLTEWWNSYFEYLNCFFLCLDSSVLTRQHYAYFELSTINQNHIWRAVFEGDSLRSMGRSGHTQSATSYFWQRRLAARLIRDLPAPNRNAVTVRLWLGTHMELLITADVLDAAVELFDAILRQDTFVHYYSEITKGLSEYKLGDYETALILAWFVIERWLVKDWESYLESKHQVIDNVQRINSDRYASLKSGRDYPASVISNAMELAGTLPLALFRQIDEVRKLRNAVVHGKRGFRCNASHAQQAINAAVEYLVHHGGPRIGLNFGIHQMGA